MAKTRIQKVLSEAGVASRREAEEMLTQGRVTVNGERMTDLPCFVEESDDIRVDGQSVRRRPRARTYILLNKPRGVVCTQRDDPRHSRPRAVDLVGRAGGGVHCVGRLDMDSTGLIVLTDDGDLTNRLTHPRFGVAKTYVVRVAGRIAAEDLAALQKGMHLDGRRARAQTKVIRRGHQESLLEIRLHEGRNRQIRRMLARLGHKVLRVHRRAIGPITDRGVKIGKFRRLAAAEVDALRKAGGGLQ